MRVNCDLCSEENNILCTKNNIGYEKHCVPCEQMGKSAIYYGETGKNMYTRDMGHKRDIISADLNTPLIKHNLNVHNQVNDVQFKTIITKSFKSALERGNNEGIRIRESAADFILNSRSEFIQPALTRQITKIGLD